MRVPNIQCTGAALTMLYRRRPCRRLCGQKRGRLPIERLERRLRLVVIGRAETLGEPALNRREKVADREAADRARRERNTR